MTRPPAETTSPQLPYAAIFFIFSPVGLLIGLVQPQAWGWGGGLAAAVFSGVLAFFWAHAIAFKRWWLIPVAIAVPFVAPRFYFGPLNATGLYTLGADASETARKAVLAIAAVVFISIGFTLLVRFIRAAEMRAARARAELDVARRMHDSIVPDIAHTSPFARVHAVSRPSSEMGGDLIDLTVHPDQTIDLLLADVSGHGVAAGLVMGMLKGASRTRLLSPGSISDVARDLNRVLHDLTPSHTFVTAAFIRIRPDRTCEYALAGHLPIYWRTASGVTTHDNDALPLSVDPAETFAARTITLQPGDALIVFTDGLPETADKSARQLGLDALRDIAARSPTSDPDRLAQVLMEAAERHGPAIDDRSVMVVQIR